MSKGIIIKFPIMRNILRIEDYLNDVFNSYANLKSFLSEEKITMDLFENVCEKIESFELITNDSLLIDDLDDVARILYNMLILLEN